MVASQIIKHLLENEDDDFDAKEMFDPGPVTNAEKLQALANEYAHVLGRSMNQPEGLVWGCYSGGGWIEVRGDNLEPHPDLAAIYPHGWSMGTRVRVPYARHAIEYFYQHGKMPPKA